MVKVIWLILFVLNEEILNIYLINNGSEINLTDKENIELLIKYRNNIYVKRKHDWSTYLLACKYGKIEIL